MSLYFIKPIVWNTQGYERPSGARFTSGYPKDNGFGHEEWNNSSRLDFIERGERKHAFHTEGFGNQLLDNAAGDIFVFMIASFGGKQFLVSVAGLSTSLFGKQHKQGRLRLFKLLKHRAQFPHEAWTVPGVRRAFGELPRFLAHWKKEQQWFVTWVCPADFFLALKSPVQLMPENITGRRRLVSMYGSYQEIDKSNALHILDQIPAAEEGIILENLRRACSRVEADTKSDIDELEARENLKPTTKKALIDARLGQGKFRKDLEDRWNSACAVTGCSVPQLLRASHIKPWKKSKDSERLNPSNGILLNVQLDALFDTGLITFYDDGSIKVSPKLLDDGSPRVDLSGKIRLQLSDEAREFLNYHRTHKFRS